MGNQQPFRAAPTELGGMGDAFCYRHIAPNGACNPPPRRPSFSTELNKPLAAAVRKDGSAVATEPSSQNYFYAFGDTATDRRIGNVYSPPAYSLQYSVMSAAASFTPRAEATRQSSQAPVVSAR